MSSQERKIFDLETFVGNLLHKEEIIKISDEKKFVLKSGEKSNVYVDLRRAFGKPKLFALLVELLSRKIREKWQTEKSSSLAICGVPYGAVPYATAVAEKLQLPLLFLRKERKLYGMGNLVEGVSSSDLKNLKVILIEDVVTTGGSAKEAVMELGNEGYNVTGIVSLLSRSESPRPGIVSCFEGIPPLDLGNNEKYWSEKWDKIKKRSGIIYATDTFLKDPNYSDDIGCPNLNIILKNRDQLAGIKVHPEIHNRNYYMIPRWLEPKQTEIFWNDRKYCDIASVVREQIQCYSDEDEYGFNFVSVCPVSGPDILSLNIKPGILVLIEMSSDGNLLSPSVTASILTWIEKNAENISGIICQSPIFFDLPFPIFCPGVNLGSSEGDGQGQKYRNYFDLLKLENKPDFFVMGRAITNDSNFFSKI